MTSTIKCDKVGKVVTVKVYSSRQLHLLPIYKGGEVYDDKGNLVEINYDDEFLVKVGETVSIKRHKYKIQKITKMVSLEGIHVSGYYLHTSTLSKSSMFVFPLLGYTRTFFEWNSSFINSFIWKEGGEEGRFIYLWYKFVPSLEMEEFEEKLKNNINFIDAEDVDDYHVLYRFMVPEKFEKDYDKIIKGKYSYITESAKERILDFHFSSPDRPIGKILYRDPERREKMEKELGIKIPEEQDLHDPFYKEEDTFFNRYKIIKSRLGW
tara:strand:+ start:165 stop:962 length:798 start_codon:yes stop_codon:yes gene_type:complete